MSDTPRVDAMIVKYPEPYSQLEINELYELARKLERELTTQNNKLAAIVRWLEVNQEDVFRRGLWDAINSSNPSHQPPPVGGRLDGVVGTPNQKGET